MHTHIYVQMVNTSYNYKQLVYLQNNKGLIYNFDTVGWATGKAFGL